MSLNIYELLFMYFILFYVFLKKNCIMDANILQNYIQYTHREEVQLII